MLRPTTDCTAPASDAGRAGAALALIALRPSRSAIRVSDTENARSNRAALATTEIDSAPRLTDPGVRPWACSDRRTALIWAAVAPKRRAN